nr:hypothetical protein [Hyphomonas sp. Mor2]
MMKTLIASIATAALSLGAQASTDLARQWGLEASRLSAETQDMILAIDRGEAPDVSDTYAVDVYRFGRTSADLAYWTETMSGSHRLGCLFQGIATESEDQLMALESQNGVQDQRDSLQRLALVFSNAERVAVAAQLRATSADPNAFNRPTPCANEVRRASLTG